MDKPLKALIICYDYPPFSSVGAQRPFNWFKYFHLSGVYPVIVTRHWDETKGDSKTYINSSIKRTVERIDSTEGSVIYVPYTSNLRDKILLNYSNNFLARLMSKLLTLFINITRYFTFSTDNNANIYRAARNLISQEKMDIIIATGEPFFVFRYADKLSQEFKIPWIADYRDGWSSNLGKNDFSRLKGLADRWIFYYIEKKIVSSATLITTVANSLKKNLQEIFPNKDIRVIQNGYDPQEFTGVENIAQRSDCFEIAFAGIAYNYMPVEIFLDGYKQFINETGCTNTRSIFYGSDFYEDIKNRILNYDVSLKKYIITTPRIPRTEIFKKLSESNLLLVLANGAIDGSNTKIFEFLRLNRRILLVVNDHGTLEGLMKECNGGIICENANDVAKALTTSYEEFKRTGKVAHQSVNYDKYSRIKQTEMLTKIVRECVA